MITITDEVGTSGTITVEDKHDVAEAIRPWYPEAPAEVHAAIDNLQDALFRARGVEGVDFDGVGAYLGVKFEIA
jgi:hypothetical protein